MPDIPSGHRLLTLGEKLQAGDLAWTWTTPECVSLGWVSIPQSWVDDKAVDVIDEGHVPVVRLDRGGQR